MSAQIQYICTYCSKTACRSASLGRPMPGICYKRPKYSNGQPKPHAWVINKKY